MPISTERYSGFSVSKWELNYLRCRYIAHRNKIASATPAIDANPPVARPHVRYKKKKALQEERRQMQVIQENLRLLDKTVNIMALTDMPTHFSRARPSQLAMTSPGDNLQKDKVRESEEEINATVSSVRKTRKNTKFLGRPLTAKLKRNTHIIFRWFIQRFGRYVPWWAEVNF